MTDRQAGPGAVRSRANAPPRVGRGETTEAAVARLWLGVLAELAGGATHEVKNALNGVAVNLEVVRSRAARAVVGGDAGSLASFAESAGAQLDQLTGLVEALLALARPARDPANVAGLVRILVLVAAAGADAGGSISLEVAPGVESAATIASGEVTRYLIGAALLAAGQGGRAARCRVSVGDGRTTVRVTADGPGVLRLPREAESVAETAGVELESHGASLTMIFPARPIDRSA